MHDFRDQFSKIVQHVYSESIFQMDEWLTLQKNNIKFPAA